MGRVLIAYVVMLLPAVFWGWYLHAERRQFEPRDLAVGDYVVHVEHGIGQYLGLKEIAQGEGRQCLPQRRGPHPVGAGALGVGGADALVHLRQNLRDARLVPVSVQRQPGPRL